MVITSIYRMCRYDKIFGRIIDKMMLKLNLQYFGHLIQRTDSLEKTLMLGKIEGRRKSGGDRG